MKTYGACIIPAVPMRAEPSHKSEMISQLLFGDLYSIEKHQSQWVKIISLSDMYEGWIDIAQSYIISTKEKERLTGIPIFFTQQLINPVITNTHLQLFLSLGSILYGQKEFSIGEYYFNVGDLFKHSKQPQNVTDSIVNIAKNCLNIPYLWGGKTVMGFDCSGFTQVIFRMHGIQLPRDASQQFEIGKKVKHLSEGKADDLAFFGDTEKITHVGILTEKNQILHCSGKVRTDSIDEKGIYIRPDEYTHKLRGIRRYW